MSKWPIAWAVPTELFNSLGMMNFVKKEIIMAFGPPQYILRDNDLKFDCKALQDFAHRFNIRWKCTSTYNPQGNGVAKRIVGILREALQKVTRIEYKECDRSLEDVLSGTGVNLERMESHFLKYCTVLSRDFQLNRLYSRLEQKSYPTLDCLS